MIPSRPGCRSPGCWATRSMATTVGCASGWNSTSGPLCWRSRRRCGRWSPARGDPGAGQGSGDGRTSGGLAPPERRGWVEGRASVRLGAVPAVPPAAGAHWLLVRRKLSKPDEMAYYVVFGPAATSLEALARIAGRRWPVEECFETAKQEVGLDGYEVRSWHGWYRHITLSMLALAFLAAMRVELASQKGAEDPAHSSQLPSACPRSVASSPASR